MKARDIDVKHFLALFEDRLKDTLSNGDNVLDEGMRYAMLDGGKRVRPTCVFLGALSVGGDVDIDEILQLSLALECVHGYSLVHDDLPAMDNDDFRRGKLSVHKAFGEANGVLVGDELLTTAMCILLDGGVKFGKEFFVASTHIANSAKFMAYGQAIDLAGCKSEGEYLDMYAFKTGALIEGGMMAGAIVAGASDKQLDDVKAYAKALGLSFQLVDDLLDIDKEQNFATLIGESKTRELLDDCKRTMYVKANNLLSSDTLISFTDNLLSRTK